MASQDIVQQLEEQLETINQYKNVALIRRPNWGEITFEKAEQDIELALSIAADLSSIPLSYLTNQAAREITRHIPNVLTWLTQIDTFNLQGAASQNRDRIATSLQIAVTGLHTAASPWIPYLAYRRGDSSENIRQIEEAVTNARALVGDAESYAAAKRTEIDEIVEAAREASASAGVATFTSEFDEEAKALAGSSSGWLWAVVALAAATVAWAVLSFYWPSIPEDANSWITLRHVVAKVSVIAVLFTATVWCGRIYRALRHQRSINRHRALSLKTFRHS